MIADKDRSGWFGASDTDKIIGNWKTETFAKWWMQKVGINRDHFDNRYTSAGTHYEHRILESLGLPLFYDWQFTIEDLRLRVNLDGHLPDCIYECKTYKYENGFKMPQKYRNQVQVQMFATGIQRAEIVVYGLVEDDYDNYFNPIDRERLQRFLVFYDKAWVEKVYLPKLKYLSHCLMEGRFP